MKIFLSWSGKRSKYVAETLRDWIENVIQNAEPWISSSDIDKGARWSHELGQALEETQFGIVVVTPENQARPWLVFEAGALSKSMELARVSAFLVDLKATDLEGPLTQFQATVPEREDVYKLVVSINKSAGEPLPLSRLDRAFKVWWPELSERFDSIPEQPTYSKAGSKDDPFMGRSEVEKTDEILTKLRSLEKSILRIESGFSQRSPLTLGSSETMMPLDLDRSTQKPLLSTTEILNMSLEEVDIILSLLKDGRTWLSQDPSAPLLRRMLEKRRSKARMEQTAVTVAKLMGTDSAPAPKGDEDEDEDLS